MSAFVQLIRLLDDESGATAVEYGLIIACIVITMIAALNEFTNEAIGMWNRVATEVADAG